jgi:hypothetical protein
VVKHLLCKSEALSSSTSTAKKKKKKWLEISKISLAQGRKELQEGPVWPAAQELGPFCPTRQPAPGPHTHP